MFDWPANSICHIAAFLMLAMGQMGCHKSVIDARSLPPQYTAAPTIDIRTLDLSKLSTRQYNSQTIQPGDTVDLQIITGAEDDPAETWPLVVKDDGSADVPLIGPVRLAGLDTKSAQAVVRDVSIQRGVYRRPTVVVSLKDRMTNRITVLGAVKEPGTYELPVAGSDLLAALVRAGGITEHADTVVEIRHSANRPSPVGGDATYTAQAAYSSAGADGGRDTAQTLRIDLVTATRGPAGSSGVALRDGDVVHVLERPQRAIQVMGLVHRPDRFDLPPGKDVRVLDAVAMAGGVTESVADKVTIVRQMPGQPEPVVIRVSLRRARSGREDNLLLVDGDHVTVDETPVTFVLGAVRQMIRIGVNGSVATF